MTLLKGALVAFTTTFVAPLPNVTLFQFNPETLTHTWSQPERVWPDQAQGTEGGNPMMVAAVPGEQFSLTIVMDSNEDIAAKFPPSAQFAAASGLYTRLAALEMLMYPVQSGSAASQLLGQVSASLGASSSFTVTTAVAASSLPVVLFVWGAFRIVPVRVMALTITEKLYDALLNPVQAEAQLTLRVLTPDELAAVTPSSQVLARLATAAYAYTYGVRQADALLNLGNAPAAIAGIS